MLIKNEELRSVPGVYGLFNKDDVCLYPGSAKEVNDAYSRHRDNLIKGKYKNTNKDILQETFDNGILFFKILELCNESERLDREQYYMDKYKETICNRDTKAKARQTEVTEEEHMRRSSANAGENNPRARLTDTQIAEIRSMMLTGEYRDRELAKIFGVSLSYISALRNNKRRASIFGNIPA